MIKVTTRYGEPAERLLGRFKRICSKEGIFKELKRRRFYEKPSEKRRRKEKERKREIKKAERRRSWRSKKGTRR